MTHVAGLGMARTILASKRLAQTGITEKGRDMVGSTALSRELLPAREHLQLQFAGRQKQHLRRAQIAAKAAGSTFGTLFRVTTFGESHGKGVGCIVDGVPPRLPISTAEIQAELDRRRPGQSRISTPRSETDTCEVYSGAGLL